MRRKYGEQQKDRAKIAFVIMNPESSREPNMLLEQEETPGRQGASNTEGANPPPPILYTTLLQVADKRDSALSRAHEGRIPCLSDDVRIRTPVNIHCWIPINK